MRLKLNIILAGLLLAGIAFGQLIQDIRDLQRPEAMHLQSPNPTGLSLLDPDRFEMRHGFSMSMLSMGGLSFSVGSYQNTMTYWINNSMRLDTDLTLYQPLGGVTPYMNQQGIQGGVLFNTTLSMRPTDNTFLSFSFGNTPIYARRFNSPFQLRTF